MNTDKKQLVSSIIFLFLCHLICIGCIENFHGAKTCNSLSPNENNQLRSLRTQARKQINEGEYSEALSTTYDAQEICSSPIHDSLIAEASKQIEQVADKKGRERNSKKQQTLLNARKARREAIENRRAWEEAQKIEAANKVAAERKAEQERQAEIAKQRQEANQKLYEQDQKLKQDAESYAQKISVQLKYNSWRDAACFNRVDIKVSCESAAAVERKNELHLEFEAHTRNSNDFPITCGFGFFWNSTHLGDFMHAVGGSWSDIPISANSRKTQKGQTIKYARGIQRFVEAKAICNFNMPDTNEKVSVFFDHNTSTYNNITIKKNKTPEPPGTIKIICSSDDILLNYRKLQSENSVDRSSWRIRPGAYVIQCIKTIEPGETTVVRDGIPIVYYNKHERKVTRSISFVIKSGETKTIDFQF